MQVKERVKLMKIQCVHCNKEFKKDPLADLHISSFCSINCALTFAEIILKKENPSEKNQNNL